LCGWGKSKCGATVRWFVGGVAPLLILPKRWLVVLSFVCLFNVCRVVNRVTANVLVLGAVADFGAQNCQYSTKFDAW